MFEILEYTYKKELSTNNEIILQIFTGYFNINLLFKNIDAEDEDLNLI